MTQEGIGDVAASIVAGADGRASTVRRQAGTSLERRAPANYVAGLLVDGLDGVPDDYDVLVGEAMPCSSCSTNAPDEPVCIWCQALPGSTASAGPDGTRPPPR